MRLLLLFSMTMLAGLLRAQEICNNGIDDDGDQLIDLQDPECDCPNQIETLLSDFEDIICCPENITGINFGFPVGGIRCINPETEWSLLTWATTDYYNTCDFLGDESLVPLIPLPIPSGNGAIGMVCSESFVANNIQGYNEGIWKCLECSLVPEETYEVSFMVGFNNTDLGIEGCCASSSPVEFTLFGRLDCERGTVIDYYSYLEDVPGWVEIARFTAEGELGEWVPVTGSFVAQDNYASLALYRSKDFVTGDVASNTLREYHFVDRIEITGRFAGGCGIVESPTFSIDLSGDCVVGYELSTDAPNVVDYQWFRDGIAVIGATSSSLNPIEDGVYQVQALFPDGNCALSDTIPFTYQGSGIIVTDTTIINSCLYEDTGSIALTVDSPYPPFSFAWSNGDTGNSVNGLTYENYAVTITDASGCERVESYEVGAFSLLAANSSVVHPTCADELGEITVNPFLGAGPLTVSWENGEVGEVVLRPPGTYVYTVTDNVGCQREYEVEVLTPTNQLQLVLASANDPSPGQEDGVISVSVSGGESPFSYQWSDGGTGTFNTGLAAGTYTVTVTDGAGCMDTLEVTLLATELLVAEVTVVENNCSEDCNGQLDVQIDGGVPPYAAVWSNGQNGESIAELCNGVYGVVVSDSSGQVLTFDNLLVSSSSDIVLQGVVTDEDCLEARNGVISIVATSGVPPYDFIWNDGFSGAEREALAPGTYEVSVQDAAGCNSAATFTVNSYTPEEIGVSVGYADCDWTSFLLTLDPTYDPSLDYLLNDQAVAVNPNGSFAPVPAGNYQLAYRDGNGCEVIFADTTLTTQPPYTLVLDESIRKVKYGEVVALDLQVISTTGSPLNYATNWIVETNDFECVGTPPTPCSSIEVIATESEVVQLSFIDEFGCEQRIGIPIVVVIEDYVYIPNAFSPNQDGINDEFRLFPTPVVTSIVSFEVYDRWGTLVYEAFDKEPEDAVFWDGTVNGSPAAPGVYVYQVLLTLANGERAALAGDVALLR